MALALPLFDLMIPYAPSFATNGPKWPPGDLTETAFYAILLPRLVHKSYRQTNK